MHINQPHHFNNIFGLPVRNEPGLIPAELSKVRCVHMVEEIKEYHKACTEGNVPEILDALIDLIYVALGTADMHGFHALVPNSLKTVFDEAFDRVHNANMNKQSVRSPGESKRNSIYDVKKPEGWVPANFTDLLKGV